MFRKSKGIKSKEKGVENVRNHRKHLRNSETQHNGLKLTQKWGKMALAPAKSYQNAHF